MNKRQQGNVGEEIACRYLLDNEYTIIKRNFYTRYGEIDIIAKNESTLIFVEVKMRKDSAFGTGAEAVTQKKIEKIQTCAQIYLQENALPDQDIRFDVIEIMGTKKKLNHIIAAF
ncbi:MAG: YraN family protein [Clostridiales bacterium]|nr:YraN family protein [Clostridiales bacterium]